MVLLMKQRFTQFLNTSKPETHTDEFLGRTRDLPGRNYKVAQGVFAQLGRNSTKQMMDDLMPNCPSILTTKFVCL